MTKILKTVIGVIIILVVVLTTFCYFIVEDKQKLPDWAMGNFVQLQESNPIIEPDPSTIFYCPAIEKNVYWESENVFNPAVVVSHDSVAMLYCAEDNSGDKIGRRTSRIGFASSGDGVTFHKQKKPVLYPDKDDQAEHEWMGGCVDPRVSVTADGTYIMFYTQWNRRYSRLAVAHSKDLKNWTKHGPVFQKAYNGKYYNTPTKSASIITKMVEEQQIIDKVNGKYFMYWGDNNIYGATSDNLIDWFPLEDGNGDLKILLSPRDGYFDSSMIECGPPALLTDKGILLFYNGENKPGDLGNLSYPPYMVAGGQALFDKNSPDRLKDRLDEPFLLSAKLEKESSVSDNRIFIQSLVYFHNEWYLYYGNGGSKIEVAVYNPEKATANPIGSMAHIFH